MSNWAQLSPDFLEGNAAIIQHTTGNLTNVREKAQFPFGVAGLAGKNSPHTVVGGGNMYFFKNASPAERQASLRFARWVSQPERAADWSMRTGYIATSPAAYDTQTMKDFIAKVPAANVARTFLPVATGELSVHENQRVYKVLTDNIQACLNGSKTPAQAMADAQTEVGPHPEAIQEGLIGVGGHAARDDPRVSAAAARPRPAGGVHPLAGDRHADRQPVRHAAWQPARAVRRRWTTTSDLLDDPVFWQALRNNAWYALATIPASIVLALVMALAVNEALPGRALLRMAYFLPTMLPMIAVANIWLFFYTPDYGLFDRIIAVFGGGRHNWLGDASTALPAMIAVAVWKEAGFFMIFYLAALQTMPTDLREAAALEGSSRWNYFRRVTLPLLMPTTLFVLVNAVINAFRVIDHIVVMTRGGPDNATTLLLYYVYEAGFRFWDTATAATATVVLLTIMALAAAFQFGVLGRRVHYR